MWWQELQKRYESELELMNKRHKKESDKQESHHVQQFRSKAKTLKTQQVNLERIHSCISYMYVYTCLCSCAYMIVYGIIDTVERAQALQRQAEGGREASAEDCWTPSSQRRKEAVREWSEGPVQ